MTARQTDGDAGAALILVLAVVLAGSTIVVAMVTGVGNATRAGGSNARLAAQDSSADSALDLGIALLRRDGTAGCPAGSWSAPLPLPELNGLGIVVVCAADTGAAPPAGTQILVRATAHDGGSPMVPDRSSVARVILGTPTDPPQILARQHVYADAAASP